MVSINLGLLILDFFIITLSWILACYFVIGPQPLPYYFKTSLFALPVLWGVKIFIFAQTGLYKAILRYASFHFARTIIKVVTMASFFSYIIINMIHYPSGKWPFGLLTIDWLLTLFFVGSLRFIPRYYLETSNKQGNQKNERKRALLYGAGDIGHAVARSLLEQKNDYFPLGFVDDDKKKIGRRVHNLSILGDRSQLAEIINKYRVQEIIVCLSGASALWLRELIKECRQYHVFCRMAPKIADIKHDDFNIKNIDIADLLKRDPKDLDEKQLSFFLHQKRILITGAAGSIGSELVRQALRYQPEKLILLDKSELGLYDLEQELHHQDHLHKGDHRNYSSLSFVLEDLCHLDRIGNLIKTQKPDIIFHAAAYKHVPILESNPSMAVVNNIQGTLNVANAADKYQVEKFVLISTDKAVRPMSIMGATKRICELYIQNLNLRSQSEFVTVRFGNVLGSSGSAIPKFLKQIKNGGPVTVTHHEMTRYFMLTQEAVQLVMQAASIGHGGEIFILNMGNPIKIKEMAEDLIFLAGKVPYKDIDIEFIGLRPGEKLYEELLISETEKKTQYENITIGKMSLIEWNSLLKDIDILIKAASENNKKKILLAIKDIVPEFNHEDLSIPNPFENVVTFHKAQKSVDYGT